MGDSSSKLRANSETGDGQKELESAGIIQVTSESSNEQSVTPTKRDKPSTLSAIGKRISFYETVDANEILPYLMVGKYIM